jgi:4,5-dihydroxyphthalate decarboxylase
MTSTDLTLTVACRGYDRVQALRDGSIKPDGITLRFLDLSVEEIFFRQQRYQEFDVSEMGMSLLMVREPADLPYVAIPAFVSRMFRHSCIFVNPEVIQSPADLVGKRIGVPEYQMTAAIWIRGLLADEYDVTPDKINWFTGGLEEPGRVQKVPLNIPGVAIQPIPQDRSIDEMLRSGELDGYIGARTPPSFASGHIVRLFPDSEEMEADYFRRTGLYPIMHSMVLRREIHEREPWVAGSLYKAFTAAKDKAIAEMATTASLQSTIPWMHASLERTRAVLGSDYWPYGFDANRPTLEKLVDYCADQHLSPRRVRAEEYFAASTLGPVSKV